MRSSITPRSCIGSRGPCCCSALRTRTPRRKPVSTRPAPLPGSQQARLLELRATVSLGRLWHQQGQARRRAADAHRGLRLVHRRVGHGRSPGGEDVAGGARVNQAIGKESCACVLHMRSNLYRPPRGMLHAIVPLCDRFPSLAGVGQRVVYTCRPLRVPGTGLPRGAGSGAQEAAENMGWRGAVRLVRGLDNPAQYGGAGRSGGVPGRPRRELARDSMLSRAVRLPSDLAWNLSSI